MAPARLPPLNALRAFEAAARLLSFKNAARELHVTPGAVSHQVKLLEEHLGRPLFRRLTRKLELTAEGAAMLPSVQDGLRSLVLAVGKAREVEGTTATRVPSSWKTSLAPKVPGENREHRRGSSLGAARVRGVRRPPPPSEFGRGSKPGTPVLNHARLSRRAVAVHRCAGGRLLAKQRKPLSHRTPPLQMRRWRSSRELRLGSRTGHDLGARPHPAAPCRRSRSSPRTRKRSTSVQVPGAGTRRWSEGSRPLQRDEQPWASHEPRLGAARPWRSCPSIPGKQRRHANGIHRQL